MAYETKEKTGALFVNENKEQERQPDYTGNIKIDGKLWRVAGWKTESRGGVDYISLKISDPADFQRPREDPKPPQRRMSDEEFQRSRNRPPLPFDDDDIPF